jgi:hypothetical protein
MAWTADGEQGVWPCARYSPPELGSGEASPRSSRTEPPCAAVELAWMPAKRRPARNAPGHGWHYVVPHPPYPIGGIEDTGQGHPMSSASSGLGSGVTHPGSGAARADGHGCIGNTQGAAGGAFGPSPTCRQGISTPMAVSRPRSLEGVQCWETAWSGRRGHCLSCSWLAKWCSACYSSATCPWPYRSSPGCAPQWFHGP